MRWHHVLDFFYRPIFIFCIAILFGSLMACAAIPTINEPTARSPATETTEVIATLSLPTFTVVLPTATFSQPTNTIPLPTLTAEPSKTTDVTEMPAATATSEATPTSEVATTSEVAATVTVVEEASPTMVEPSVTVGTSTATIVLPTFTALADNSNAPLSTQTVGGNNPTPILASTATQVDQTALEATAVPTQTALEATVVPTQTALEPTAIPTQIPLQATALPTQIPLQATAVPAAPDADETSTSTFFTTLPLDAFTALPKLEDLDYNKINPAQAVQYWELRFAFPGETSEVIGSAGSREGINAALLAQFDALTVDTGFDIECLPGYCFKYVVSISDNGIQTWQTVDELTDFLGQIDSSEEAILLVAAHEYNWSNEAGKETGSFRAVEDGYQFIVTKLVNDCDPVQTDRYLLHNSTSGSLTIQHSEIWTQYMGMCI